MKKIICLSTLFLFLAFAGYAQTAVKTASVKTTKSCTPMSPEECAAKMGVSLEEYEQICKKKCNKTAQASLNTSSVIPAVMVSNTAKTTKACSSSLEACAKKMGMTVAECKAKCPGGSLGTKATQVKSSSSGTKDVLLVNNQK